MQHRYDGDGHQKSTRMRRERCFYETGIARARSSPRYCPVSVCSAKRPQRPDTRTRSNDIINVERTRTLCVRACVHASACALSVVTRTARTVPVTLLLAGTVRDIWHAYLCEPRRLNARLRTSTVARDYRGNVFCSQSRGFLFRSFPSLRACVCARPATSKQVSNLTRRDAVADRRSLCRSRGARFRVFSVGLCTLCTVCVVLGSGRERRMQFDNSSGLAGTAFSFDVLHRKPVLNSLMPPTNGTR